MPRPPCWAPPLRNGGLDPHRSHRPATGHGGRSQAKECPKRRTRHKPTATAGNWTTAVHRRNVRTGRRVRSEERRVGKECRDKWGRGCDRQEITETTEQRAE